MIAVVVICLFLLLIAALGQSWWWRAPAPYVWYGSAAFYWGVFLLALYVTWPVLRPALGMH
jgi:hypothetical protein